MEGYPQETGSPNPDPTPGDLAAIVRASPPGTARPELAIPRHWSNVRLQEPDTLIALVLSHPSTEDLVRTIAAYGPERVIEVLGRLEDRRELDDGHVHVLRTWMTPILKGVADAAREIAPA